MVFFRSFRCFSAMAARSKDKLQAILELCKTLHVVLRLTYTRPHKWGFLEMGPQNNRPKYDTMIPITRTAKQGPPKCKDPTSHGFRVSPCLGPSSQKVGSLGFGGVLGPDNFCRSALFASRDVPESEYRLWRQRCFKKAKSVPLRGRRSFVRPAESVAGKAGQSA